MSIESLVTPLLGSAALATASALAADVLQRVGRRRAKTVEQEMIRALGIGEAPDKTSQTTSEEQLGRVFRDSPPSAANDNRQASGGGNQHIEVNIGSDSASSEALAEIATQQSDGHARLIVKYYAQGHQQAFTTFIASVAFAIVGFGVIIAACIYLFLHPSEPEPAAISGAVGLATQGVSYLFFRRADKARELMMSLIDRLREDREREVKFIAGLASTNAITSPSLRDAVRVATSIHLAGATMTPEQIESIAKHSAVSDLRHQPNIFINPPSSNGLHTDDEANGGEDSAGDEGEVASTREKLAD
jgi:hypothetical protein